MFVAQVDSGVPTRYFIDPINKTASAVTFDSNSGTSVNSPAYGFWDSGLTRAPQVDTSNFSSTPNDVYLIDSSGAELWRIGPSAHLNGWALDKGSHGRISPDGKVIQVVLWDGVDERVSFIDETGAYISAGPRVRGLFGDLVPVQDSDGGTTRWMYSLSDFTMKVLDVTTGTLIGSIARTVVVPNGLYPVGNGKVAGVLPNSGALVLVVYDAYALTETTVPVVPTGVSFAGFFFGTTQINGVICGSYTTSSGEYRIISIDLSGNILFDNDYLAAYVGAAITGAPVMMAVLGTTVAPVVPPFWQSFNTTKEIL